jgi:drug/metabolite transporter (DMT)-like permease
MLVAIVGTLVTTLGDLRFGESAVLGDGLALGGAVCLAGYLLIGRRVRGSTGVAGYSSLAFGVVSLTALAVTTAAGSLHVPSGRTLLLGLALAVVCTLGGHTAYNWALRYVSALTVSVAFLGEPPLTSLLGFLLVGSTPSVTTLAGGLVILTWLAVTLRSEARAAATAPVIELE